MADFVTNYAAYLKTLKSGDYTKLAKLDFLYPDGGVAFTVDSEAKNGAAFLQDGTLSVNLQNGTRRTASVTLANADGLFTYDVNGLWFGQQVRLSEGLILPDGTAFYIPQGVFYIKDPEDVWKPGQRTVTLNLVDKWAYLDGSLFGNLDGIYEVPAGTDIFSAMASVLKLGRGNGYAVDEAAPIFTDYYNEMTQELPDGTEANLTDSPYTLRVDSDGGTYADIMLGLNDMLVGMIGYDSTGRLRVEPSQDDLDDTEKEVLWNFTPDEKQLLGATYVIQNSQVFNDIIVQGEPQDDYKQPYARVRNTDPRSDLNVYGALGIRTKLISAAGYCTDRQCEDRAAWELKRNCILKKSVTIESGQIFHIQENRLVTIRRTDKPGQPIEKHLVTGFSRPIGQTGRMTIQATSAEDIAVYAVPDEAWVEQDGSTLIIYRAYNAAQSGARLTVV